ncbi:hypothetical protein ATO6_04375 [Oceanicola sp. 22II-s10i]|nr:hypothetical protein ATO6_04375 [Oceanicola sp. 22II-s10i]
MPQATPDPGGQSGEGYTAIVHFHGMGSQRRYEESCRLIDAMDVYLRNRQQGEGKSLGRLVGIGARQEPDRRSEDGIVTYMRARHLPAPHQTGGEREIRVYECYWAPAMAGSKSAYGIGLWMLKQVLRPIYSAATPWWERHRLRESMLRDLQQCPHYWPEGVTDQDFDRMLGAYGRFRKSLYHRGWRGYFWHFLKLFDTGLRRYPEAAKRMKKLAWVWWIYAHLIEARNAFLLGTLLLTLVLSLGGLVWSVFHLLQIIATEAEGTGVLSTIRDLFGDHLKPTVQTAAGIVVSGLSLIGVTRFLTESMGDVYGWSTYTETDATFERRAKVLTMGQDTLRHVLCDPDCGRVVVTAHSLGTSVAFDTIPLLAMRNLAHGRSNPIAGPIPLEKISHFVTMGSPIDKIHYFFGGQRSKVLSFLDVLDQLKTTTARMPFVKNRKPHIHWINYWDDADPISGPLQSPVESGPGARAVDDVHVQSYDFPAPARSHNAYFENRTVIDGLFRMTVLNEMNYSNLPLLPDDGGYDYDSVTCGPGLPRGRRRGWALVALAVPYAALATVIAVLTGNADLARWIGYPTAGVAALLVLFWRASLRRGNLEKL